MSWFITPIHYVYMLIYLNLSALYFFCERCNFSYTEGHIKVFFCEWNISYLHIRIYSYTHKITLSISQTKHRQFTTNINKSRKIFQWIKCVWPLYLYIVCAMWCFVLISLYNWSKIANLSLKKKECPIIATKGSACLLVLYKFFTSHSSTFLYNLLMWSVGPIVHSTCS